MNSCDWMQFSPSTLQSKLSHHQLVRRVYNYDKFSSWWSQPIWKILVKKMGIFPKQGMKKNISKTTTQFWFTPWKINMEHTNHPFREENDLPKPLWLCSMLIFQGVCSGSSQLPELVALPEKSTPSSRERKSPLPSLSRQGTEPSLNSTLKLMSFRWGPMTLNFHTGVS